MINKQGKEQFKEIKKEGQQLKKSEIRKKTTTEKD